MNRLIQAIHFSSLKHTNQRRKDKDATPYINHPIDVMHILSSSGVEDIDTLMGAVLHDTLEDTKTTYNELVREFGYEVADLVKEVSDDKTLSKVDRKKAQIAHAKHCSDKAKLIKLADKLSNLSSLQDTPPVDWSIAVIEGYIYWSYAVVSHLRGINPRIDSILDIVFYRLAARYGLDMISLDLNLDVPNLDTKLEEYYHILEVCR